MHTVRRTLRPALRLSLLAAVLAPAPAAAQTPLDDAPVPSLCGHPAGTLVGGQLPGIPENEGGVSLTELYQPGMIATGTIRSAGDYVAVLSCSRGGVGWPANLVFYDAGKQIIGSFDLYDITEGGRESVARLTIRGRTVIVDIENIARKGDADCCGSATARAKIRWDARQGALRVTAKKIFNERATARRLIRAVNRGRRKAAAKLASPSVIDQLFDLRRRGARLRGGGCHGALSDEWWISMLSEEEWMRACLVSVRYRAGGEQAWAVAFTRRGMHGYRATVIRGVAG